MTTTHAPDIRFDVERLVPDLRPRAGDIEANRSLPRDVLDDLVSAGCFHFLLPRDFGGVEATLPEALGVFETLARADASVGWLVMIGSGIWIDIARLPRASFDDVVGGGNLLAGVFRPAGVAQPRDGGYRVSGRWPYASGCGHSDWIYGNCLDASGTEPVVRAVVFRADEVHVEDTWHVLGMRGTGSHDVVAHDVLVPEERTCTDGDPLALDLTILRIPPPALFSLALASVALGTAVGAVEEMTARSADRTPLFAAGPQATNPLHHHDLAQTDADLRAARSLLHERAADLWATAEAGDPITLAQRARTRAAAVWIADRALDAVGWTFRAGGAPAIHDGEPLQRRWRDISTMCQHFLVRPDTMVTAGAVLSGQELDLAVF